MFAGTQPILHNYLITIIEYWTTHAKSKPQWIQIKTAQDSKQVVQKVLVNCKNNEWLVILSFGDAI